MAFRTEAGLRASRRRFEMVLEPTGSPVSIYALTMEFRISRSLPVNDPPTLISY
jgi:hypothetical protein